MPSPQYIQMSPRPFGAKEMMLSGQMLAEALQNPYKQSLEEQKMFEDRRVRDIQAQVAEMQLNQAKQAELDKKANIEFSKNVIANQGNKTWLPLGEVMGSKEEDIIKNLAIPEDLMGKMEVKKYIDTLSDAPNKRAEYGTYLPTSEDLDKYNEYMKAQEDFSKRYDTMGQKQYLSEIMGQEIAERERLGQPVTETMLAQMAAAKTQEIKDREQLMKLYPKEAKESQDKADKLLVDIAKLETKNVLNKFSENNKDAPITSEQRNKLEKAISNEISPFGITLGEKELKSILDTAVEKGISSADVEKALYGAIDRGFIDTTFDANKAKKILNERFKELGVPKDPKSSAPTDALKDLYSKYLAEAKNAKDKALLYSLPPEELRKMEAQENLNKLLGIEVQYPATETPAPVTAASTAAADIAAAKTDAAAKKDTTKTSPSTKLVSGAEDKSRVEAHNKTARNISGNTDFNPFREFKNTPSKSVKKDINVEMKKIEDEYMKKIKNSKDPVEKAKLIREKNQKINEIENQRPLHERLFDW